MSAVQELTERLRALPEKEREEMAKVLLEEMKAQEWDRQIEADVNAGQLDHLVAEAKRYSDRRRSWIAGKKPGPKKVRDAIRGLRAFRKNITLGGLRIRDLIEEGRR
jgi:hypothetical protein